MWIFVILVFLIAAIWGYIIRRRSGSVEVVAPKNMELTVGLKNPMSIIVNNSTFQEVRVVGLSWC